jgi:hypothetical protein
MEKSRLLNFINKYHLAGNVEKTVLQVKDDKIYTEFVTEDKKVIGYATLNNIKDVDAVGTSLPIYETSRLVKVLNTLGDDVKLSLNKVGEKPVSINVSDETGKSKTKFPLSDIDVMPKVPLLKGEPEYVTVIKLTPEFNDKYIRTKSVFGNDTLIVNFKTTDETATMSLGNKEVNDLYTEMEVETESLSGGIDVDFNANLLKEILLTNKNVDAKFYVSKEGLGKIEYIDEDTTVKYFLLKIKRS